MAEVQKITPATHTESAKALNPMLQQMEEDNLKLLPHIRTLDAGQSSTPLTSLSDATQSQVLEIVDQLCVHEEAGPLHQNAIRRLHALLNKVAEVVEKYDFQKQCALREKEDSVKGKVATIQGKTRLQGWINTCGGFGSPILQMAGLAIGGPLGQLISGLGQLTPQGTRALELFVESAKQGDEFDKQHFLSLISSERDTLKTFANLPQNIQQLILKLIDLERESIRATDRR